MRPAVRLELLGMTWSMGFQNRGAGEPKPLCHLREARWRILLEPTGFGGMSLPTKAVVKGPGPGALLRSTPRRSFSATDTQRVHRLAAKICFKTALPAGLCLKLSSTFSRAIPGLMELRHPCRQLYGLFAARLSFKSHWRQRGHSSTSTAHTRFISSAHV